MATTTHTTQRYHPDGTPDLPEEHSATQHVSLATYLIVFAALMVLLVVTALVAFYVHAGDLNLIIALVIATIKAALVVLFFMHVKYASRLTKIFVVAAFLWLAILFAFTFADYVSRDWQHNSRGWVDQAEARPEPYAPPVASSAGH